MCYTGKCKYEDHNGDCSLNCISRELPNDAGCIEQGELMYKEELEKELLEDYYKKININNTKEMENIEEDPFAFLD